jgi:hypothetical protein
MYSKHTEYSPHNSCHYRVFTRTRPDLCTTIPNKVIRHSFKQGFSLFHLGICDVTCQNRKMYDFKLERCGQ